MGQGPDGHLHQHPRFARRRRDVTQARVKIRTRGGSHCRQKRASVDEMCLFSAHFTVLINTAAFSLFPTTILGIFSEFSPTRESSLS